MRLPFEEPDDALALLPMAARRALDRAGLKLSLEGWQSLPFEARRDLVLAGAGEGVDTARVIALCAGAAPAARPIDPQGEVTELPGAVREAGLGEAAWRALSPLARYALASFARRGKTERLAEALAALDVRQGRPHHEPAA